MHQQLLTTPARPSRSQIEPAALELLSRHSAGLLATARRYSVCPEDAEDAYQRGVEILLTKAPTTRETELLPWLKTVVKHEAHAVRKSGTRAVLAEEPLELDADAVAWTDEQAERYEQLRVGAEAMAGLKPQEIRCLVLKAEGLSYSEICSATGWTYTKVNRCLTEGRRAFLARVAGIESGAECERLAPLISKLADGEASAEEMQKLRPHLKGCLACKATLREYRATPSRLAGLVPPVVALAGGGQGSGFIGQLMERFASMGDAAGAKVAAVAAAGALVAGGGAAVVHHDTTPVPGSAFESTKAGRSSAPSASAPAATKPSATPPLASSPDPSTPAMPAVADPPSPDSAATTSKTTARVDPAPEFDPGAGTGSPASAQPAEFAPSPPDADPPATTPGEFGP